MSGNWLSLRIAYLAAILGGIVCSQTPAVADTGHSQSADPLDTIVVRAKRTPAPIADEELTIRVAAVLHEDPFFYDEHVTVTVRNGVATLHGIVFDDWDLRLALRLARKIAGVKRVVDDLEIKLGGE